MEHYYLLGRSGLRVSRLALGTMNFGVDGFHAAYGKAEEESEAIFRRYVEAGGNFIDTERERPTRHLGHWRTAEYRAARHSST